MNVEIHIKTYNTELDYSGEIVILQNYFNNTNIVTLITPEKETIVLPIDALESALRKMKA